MTATLHKLKINVNQFGVAGQHLSAIERNLQRGLPEFVPSLVSHDGTMVIVGSGYSLPTFIEDIRAERAKGRPICAVKGSHDLLCEHGIEPDLFISVEPRDRRNNIKKKNERTIYLLASRVAPEVFDYLRGCRVMIWNSFGHHDEVKTVNQHSKSKFAIGGGSTSGLRAIGVCAMMGFRNFVLYGFDSCNGPNGEKRFDGSQTGITTDVTVGGKTFICNMAMAAQANEFQTVTYGLFDDIHIEAKGDGLIAAIIEERKRQGKRT